MPDISVSCPCLLFALQCIQAEARLAEERASSAGRRVGLDEQLGALGHLVGTLDELAAPEARGGPELQLVGAGRQPPQALAQGAPRRAAAAKQRTHAQHRLR